MKALLLLCVLLFAAVALAQRGDPDIFRPGGPGPCKAAIPRFFCNNGRCEQFLYGGCQGGANNFRSLEECQRNCGGFGRPGGLGGFRG
uniref:Putative serine protease inhibitor 3 n=1 Tax=Ixodes ricinus TaxID=34613 RepID=V5H942_IXORI